jgi:hypothetical protein
MNKADPAIKLTTNPTKGHEKLKNMGSGLDQ